MWHYNFWYVPHVSSLYCTIGAASLALYGLLKFQNVAAVKAGFALVVYLVRIHVTLTRFGTLYEISIKYASRWRKQLRTNVSSGRSHSKYLLKQLNAWPPCKTFFGDFSYISSDTYLVTVDTVINNAVTLLLL